MCYKCRTAFTNEREGPEPFVQEYSAIVVGHLYRACSDQFYGHLASSMPELALKCHRRKPSQSHRITPKDTAATMYTRNASPLCTPYKQQEHTEHSYLSTSRSESSSSSFFRRFFFLLDFPFASGFLLFNSDT
jgi:hypothetical protein